MSRIFTFLMLIALSATIFSCGDDDKEEVKPVDPLTEAKATLSGHTWHYMRFYVSDNQIEETSECVQASETYYKSDGVYEVIRAEICDNQEDVKGTWRITDAMDSLITTRDGYTSSMILVELTDERLLLEMPDKGNNVNAGWKFEYIAK